MELSDSEKSWIEVAYKLEGGQTRYQNQNFVCGSQITPFKKIQQALLELQMRDNSRVELEYRLKKNAVALKKLEREYQNVTDELDREEVLIEIEKAKYDRTIWEQKYRLIKKEVEHFVEELEKDVDPEKGIEYYLTTNEEEDRKYWISRMAKQAACDIIAFGHVGTGNMDSIMNMHPDDQVQALSGAVHHSALIDAGVKQLRAQMAPSHQAILEGTEKFSPPQINGSEITDKLPSLPEVKYDIPKEKIRLQSSNKSQN
jgi:hypothetical protein